MDDLFKIVIKGLMIGVSGWALINLGLFIYYMFTRNKPRHEEGYDDDN